MRNFGIWRRVRRSSVVWWACSVVLGLLTATVVGSAVGKATQAADAWGTEQSVWVVRRAVAAGDAFSAADVELTRRPQGVVPDGALDATSSPIGEGTRVAVTPGEIVLTNRLAGRGATGVAAMVGPGFRAVAVPNDDALPRVRPGDRVDVIATFEVGDDTGASSTQPSFAVASNAEVLEVTAQAITVAVREREAPRLAFALAKAAVTIALRGGELASDSDSDDQQSGRDAVDDEGGEGLGLDQAQ